jgi:hypothetical protein
MTYRYEVGRAISHGVRVDGSGAGEKGVNCRLKLSVIAQYHVSVSCLGSLRYAGLREMWVWRPGKWTRCTHLSVLPDSGGLRFAPRPSKARSSGRCQRDYQAGHSKHAEVTSKGRTGRS